jgi:penicillin amidase
MMKKFFAIFLMILVALSVYFLNKPLGTKPAIGKFLSPTHGFWQNANANDNVSYSFEVNCPSGNKATVVIDSIAIPHIFAESETDLFFTQGYVQAQFRLWQMEFQTMFASGRLSEIVGEKALEIDRFNRRIGIARAAKISVEELSKDEKSVEITNAFSDGVNAYIKTLHAKNLPIEYKLLGYKPEKWSAYKSALLMKFMAFDLTYSDVDVEYTNALKLLGSDVFKTIYPDFPFPSEPIIPENTAWNFKNIDSFKQNSTSLLSDNLYPNPYKDKQAKKFVGSNNWAVSGSKSYSGKPILCNDPHLLLNLPSIWFAMQLQTKDMNVMGVTIPGAPGIIIGFNDSIAWGVTNASRDVINTYAVTYKPNDKTKYKLGNTYQKVTYQIDTIKIRGKEDFIDSIKLTLAGAIVYDENFGAVKDKMHLAIYWRAMEPSNELLTFYNLNKAKNHQDYLNALNTFGCPGQNFVYADVNNNIAIKQQGHFMLRSQANDGSFIELLENVNLNKLKSSIPNQQNPYVLNPARGFVSSANQKPVGASYPYETNGQYENYRNRVINSELSSMKNIKPKDLMKLQGNNLSLLAKETLPFMLSYLDTTRFKDSMSIHIISTFSKWDYQTNYQYLSPSYFYKWFEYITTLTWDELQQKNVSFVIPENYVLANLLVNNPNFSMFDIKSTTNIENAKDIVNLAFDKTRKFFIEYIKENKTTNWQQYKNTTVLHMAKINAFSTSKVPIGGYHNIVNATSDRWGASWRMVVDFANGKPKGYGVYPGGQSGNPSSQFYNNMIPIWAKNEYYELSFFNSKKQALNNIKK